MYNFILKNSKFKNLINDIAIDFLSFWNLASVEDVRKKCNPIVDLSKFTFNKKKKNVEWSCNLSLQDYNQVCCQILFKI